MYTISDYGVWNDQDAAACAIDDITSSENFSLHLHRKLQKIYLQFCEIRLIGESDKSCVIGNQSIGRSSVSMVRETVWHAVALVYTIEAERL